jgi:hypothetical protein
MALAKQYSGYYFKQFMKKRLWRRYGYERRLRADESVLRVITYIVMNPVKAGLVTQPADYPFWGSTVYSRDDILKMLMLR